VAFGLIESRVATDPLVPLRMFASRALTGSNLAMFCFGASMFAMWFFLTQYLQYVLGLSPLQTGLAFVPQTAAIAAGATLAGRVAPRYGPRNVIIVGAALAAAGLYWLSLMTAHSTYWNGAFGGGILCTFGMGLAFTPIAMAATGSVRPADAGLASGLVNTSRQVGASLGLALLATLAATRTQALQAAGVPKAVAETAGYAHGLGISAGFALAAVFVAMLIPAKPRPPAEGAGRPATAASSGATSVTPAPEPA
jgi:MFS family permease